MGFWQALLSMDLPAGSILRSIEPSVRTWLAVLWTLGLMAAAGVAVIYLYGFESKRVLPSRRLLLATLRIGVVGVLAVLIFRPVQCVAVFQGERPRGVALLIDNSRSMSRQDQRLSAADRIRAAIARNRVPPETPVNNRRALDRLPTGAADNPRRCDLVAEVLTNPALQLRQRLLRLGPLRTYLFGSRLHGLGTDFGEQPDAVAAALKADEPSTALADSLQELLHRGEGDPPAAIVVMTDGCDNASKNDLFHVAEECHKAGVPLHFYGVGSTEGGSLQLLDVMAPDVIFAEDTVSVPVRWRSQGIKTGTVLLTLKLGDREVARREFPAQEGESFHETLAFTPPTTQIHDERLDLVAEIRHLGSAVPGDTLKRATRLIDRKVKLLYVEGAPRWDYKFLIMTLLRDRRVEAHFLLINGDPTPPAAGSPMLLSFPNSRKELFDNYDLLILGDVPASFFGPERMGWIQEFVSRGGGLVQLAGRLHAPASYSGTPLEKLLPIEFTALRFPPIPLRQVFHAVPTRAGEHNDMLSLADSARESQQSWQGLPGFYWHYPVTRLRPGAMALLSAHKGEFPSGPFASEAADDKDTLMAIQYYGRGQVLFIGSDETWRWRLNTQDTYFARLWGQIIYFVGLPHTLGTRQSQLGLDRSEVLVGRPSQVFARLFDAQYNPLKQDKVMARLECLDTPPAGPKLQEIEMRSLPGQPGEYRATLANDQPGRFNLRIEAGDHASLEYRVGLPPQDEMATLGMAEGALVEAARISGGAFYREEDLQHLVDQIVPKRASFIVRQQVLPWNPLAFLIFAALLTAEWVLRKLSNLS